MSERKTLSGKDWASIVLFGAGSLGAVLMFLALRAEKPLPAYGPLGTMAEAWKNAFGIFPSLFFNGALMWIGFRIFVMEARENVVRNLVASFGLTVALSVLVGAFSREAGGAIGERTSWFVANQTHMSVGVLLGMIAVFTAIWFGWLRATNLGDVAEEAPTEQQATAVAAKTAAKAIVRPAVAKTTAANEGVSAAESAALFPDEDELPVVRKLEPAEFVKAPIPPSPYPEDVRRKGQIPAGAKPLVDPNASVYAPDAPEAPVAPTIYRFTGTRPEPVTETVSSAPSTRVTPPIVDANEADVDAQPTRNRARAVEDETVPIDLPAASWEQPALFQPEEGDEEPVDAYGTPMTLVEKLRQARRDSGIEGASASATADADVAEVDTDDDVSEEELVTTRTIEVVSSASIVEDVPMTSAAMDDDEDDLLDLDDDDEDDVVDEESDEDADDEDESEEDEEDSDEYDLAGDESEEDAETATEPTVVVRAVSVPREIDDVGDESDEDEVPMARAAAIDPVVHAPARATVVVPVRVEELSAEVPAVDEADELEAALHEEEVAAQTAADVDEDEYEVDDEEVDSEEVDEEVVATTADDADEDTDEISDEESDETSVVVAAAEVETFEAEEFEADADAETEPETQVEAAVAASSAPVITPHARGSAAARADSLQPSLFDAVETSAPAAHERASREVVLQPQPAAASDRTPRAPKTEAASDVDPRRKLLSEIGCLFIERGRVAVSMLQRQYEMDFDDACKVLDDLQEMGLIGPYLGGQRRDILLTREQWLERVSQAGAMR